MRKSLAIFLLLLMPLQFTWAAVSSYCQHESGVAANHIGHHDDHANHTNAHSNSAKATDVSIDNNSDKLPGTLELECGHCHGTCGVMLSAASGVSSHRTTALPRGALDEAGSARAPTRPERPQWLPLA